MSDPRGPQPYPQQPGQPYQGQPYQGQPYQGQPYQGQPGRGGYPPQGPGGQPGYRPSGPTGGAPRKSPLLIIGIVVAAVIALVAIGGIVIGLSSGSRDVPATTITPGPQTPPPDVPSADPSASSAPTGEPSGGATPGGGGSGSTLDLGHDISLTPADGWDVRKQTASLAQLSDGKDVFIGQTAKLDPGSNPGQVCTAWHKQLAESQGGGTFSEPKTADVGAAKLKAATCSARITASSGQGSSALVLVTVVSVRSTDGVTVLGTMAFTGSADQDQLGKDFGAMTNSMLSSQADG